MEDPAAPTVILGRNDNSWYTLLQVRGLKAGTEKDFRYNEEMQI